MNSSHLGYNIVIRPAFTGFYALVIEDDENQFTIIPYDSDHSIPAQDAHGFSTEEIARRVAKARLARFQDAWKATNDQKQLGR